MSIIGNVDIALQHMAAKGQKPLIKMDLVTGTAAAVVTSVDLGEIVTDFHFQILMSATTETVTASASVDGTNYHDLINCVFTLGTRNLSSPTTGAVKAGDYFIPLEFIAQYRHVKFTKSATTETCNLAYAFGQLPGNA